LDGPGGGTAGGAKNKEVEKHPERRFKAALAAYTEREMPQLKIDHPGLRKQQMEQLIYKNFQKSPENPFNQANILDYNATQDDVQESKGKYSDQFIQRRYLGWCY
jgi:Coiled-coil domain-containing protein 124 /Oxs1